MLFRPHLVQVQKLILAAFTVALLAPLLLSGTAISEGPFGELGALAGLLL